MLLQSDGCSRFIWASPFRVVSEGSTGPWEVSARQQFPFAGAVPPLLPLPWGCPRLAHFRTSLPAAGDAWSSSSAPARAAALRAAR